MVTLAAIITIGKKQLELIKSQDDDNVMRSRRKDRATLNAKDKGVSTVNVNMLYER